jgi:hypothetical protein
VPQSQEKERSWLQSFGHKVTLTTTFYGGKGAVKENSNFGGELQ